MSLGYTDLRNSGSYSSLVSEELPIQNKNELDNFDPRLNTMLVHNFKMLESPQRNTRHEVQNADLVTCEPLSHRTRLEKCKDWFVHHFLGRLTERDQMKVQSSLTFVDIVRDDLKNALPNLKEGYRNSALNYIVFTSTEGKVSVEDQGNGRENIKHNVKFAHGVSSEDIKRANDLIDDIKRNGNDGLPPEAYYYF